MDELVDVAERQLLIHIGTSDAFEEAESLHLVLNRNLTCPQKVRLRKTNFWMSGQIRNAPLTY